MRLSVDMHLTYINNVVGTSGRNHYLILISNLTQDHFYNLYTLHKDVKKSMKTHQMRTYITDKINTTLSILKRWLLSAAGTVLSLIRARYRRTDRQISYVNTLRVLFTFRQMIHRKHLDKLSSERR